jgi:cytochrome b6-f complex iron-sulfur subunit
MIEPRDRADTRRVTCVNRATRVTRDQQAARETRTAGGRHEPARRRFLCRAAAAVAALVAGPAAIQLGGCRDENAATGSAPLRVALNEIPADGRLVVYHAADPIELRRTDAGVAARSLICTHKGCTVQWKPDRQRYVCPCHQGVFAPDGRPLQGAPTAPLADLPVRVEGGTVIVEVAGP